MPKIRAKPQRGRWSAEELKKLREVVAGRDSDDVDWDVVASAVPFTSKECFNRWSLELPKKGVWSAAEDRLLINAIAHLGIRAGWSAISDRVPGRTPKRCRERWVNQLDPGICHGPWSAKEDRILLDSQRDFGNKWAKIAALLPGRTANNVKNRWYGHFRPPPTPCRPVSLPVFIEPPPTPFQPAPPPVIAKPPAAIQPPSPISLEPPPPMPAPPPKDVRPPTPPISHTDFLASCLDFSRFPEFPPDRLFVA